MQKVQAIVIASGTIGRSEYEAIGAAKRLADRLGGESMIVIVGPNARGMAHDAKSSGVGKIFIAEHPLLAEYSADIYLAATEQAFRAAQSDVLIFPGHTVGLELAPRLAYRINSAIVTDCTNLQALQGGAVQITKPVYGGKAETLLIAKEPPVAICLRSRSFDPYEPVAASNTEMIPVELALAPSLQRTRVVERIVEESGESKLDDARIIVSGGRGIGGPENFRLLEELAQLLNGATGASRAACDAGWVPTSWQIGQTGKKVAPELYIAVGISGASQHMVGISGAKKIVAINKDAKAPIFKAADIGIVDEYQKVIPALIERLKKRQATL
ncbi:MAG: electron transfer flavoprotein subunit alpha/FixB family protein [Acidobacteria bacterium]|nr:electron transfer flavoprotein subunit alpha/FixB family protein [Acidobacteriota bacterium]